MSVSQILSQSDNEIVVHFNQDELNIAAAENRAFYRVTDTKATLDPSDDVIILPESVAYDPVNNVATLTFSSSIPDSTHRLTIGTSNESNDTLETSIDLGTVFEGTPIVAFDIRKTSAAAA